MATFENQIQKRERYATQAFQSLNKAVKSLQRSSYERLVEWSVNLENEGGKITYSAKNFSSVQGIFELFKSFSSQFKKSVLGFVIQAARKLFGMNEEYIKGQSKAVAVPDIQGNVLLRWGYDAASGTIIQGGYFDKLFSFRAVAEKIAALTNTAISSGFTLKQFQAAFRNLYLTGANGGLIEAYFNTNTFDLFHRIDRAANEALAKVTGLNYALYSGTVILTTRDFCKQKVNRVFSRQEIEAWKNQSWKGKNKYYDPYQDCGGYNCRHHLSFVSDELAQHLRK